jgi:hypothetical protein
MNASTVVAVCATVIAVVSLVVSVYEVAATRRHNRLSVRPLLELRPASTLAAPPASSSSTPAWARPWSPGRSCA